MGLFNTAANTSQPDGVDLIETSSKIGILSAEIEIFSLLAEVSHDEAKRETSASRERNLLCCVNTKDHHFADE